jgi:hypothetical protein
MRWSSSLKAGHAGNGPAVRGATWAAGPRFKSIISIALLLVVIVIFAFELWWIANC